jgi:antirestriction protein ArdC
MNVTLTGASCLFLCLLPKTGDSNYENDSSKTSSKYIRGWLKALKDDKKMLVMAAAQGQKAADYILNRKEDQIELDEAA